MTYNTSCFTYETTNERDINKKKDADTTNVAAETLVQTYLRNVYLHMHNRLTCNIFNKMSKTQSFSSSNPSLSKATIGNFHFGNPFFFGNVSLIGELLFRHVGVDKGVGEVIGWRNGR